MVANLSKACWLAVACVLCCATTSTAQRLEIEQIPSPRNLSPPGWISDTTATVSAESAEYINRVGDELHDLLDREMAIVVVRTTDGENHREYATRLFNHWGIGRQGIEVAPGVWRNDGVLLFAAIDDRRAEIVLGDGIDSAKYENIAQQIIDDIVVPNFKTGDADSALYQGARACATRIFAISDLNAPPLLPSVSGLEAQARGPKRQRRGPVTWWPWLAGAGLMGGAGLLVGSRYYARYRPRVCEKCQLEMVLLEEDQDDSFLDPGEQLEERLGSVDYDVWACLQCEQVRRFRYGRFFTRFSHCPKCNYVTVNKIEKVLVQANYSHGGKVRVIEDCHHCSYLRRYSYRTPKLVKPKSNSSSSSFGGGGGGGGFGGGSSSSGFGGGSSSGGGAGGGW